MFGYCSSNTLFAGDLSESGSNNSSGMIVIVAFTESTKFIHVEGFIIIQYDYVVSHF